MNGNYTAESGEEVVSSGKAAAVVYGRNYVANPDFVKRIQEGLPLAEINMKVNSLKRKLTACNLC